MRKSSEFRCGLKSHDFSYYKESTLILTGLMRKKKTPWKPTAADLAAAYRTKIPDLFAPDLRVVFCGINPSLYSAAVGHHFARPGNRFWPALHLAGFTPRLLSPFEDKELLEWGYGLTNIATPATARADELTNEELLEGAKRLKRKLLRYRPKIIAFLGISSFRVAFGCPVASIGQQPERIGDTVAWVLPNPSGLNAHYQLKDLAKLYATLREAAEKL